MEFGHLPALIIASSIESSLTNKARVYRWARIILWSTCFKTGLKERLKTPGISMLASGRSTGLARDTQSPNWQSRTRKKRVNRPIDLWPLWSLSINIIKGGLLSNELGAKNQDDHWNSCLSQPQRQQKQKVKNSLYFFRWSTSWMEIGNFTKKDDLQQLRQNSSDSLHWKKISIAVRYSLRSEMLQLGGRGWQIDHRQTLW